MNSSKKILILGVNGFIGSSLAWKILKKTNWSIVGADLASNKIQNCLGNERFEWYMVSNREKKNFHLKRNAYSGFDKLVRIHQLLQSALSDTYPEY